MTRKQQINNAIKAYLKDNKPTEECEIEDVIKSAFEAGLSFAEKNPFFRNIKKEKPKTDERNWSDDMLISSRDGQVFFAKYNSKVKQWCLNGSWQRWCDLESFPYWQPIGLIP